MGGVIELPSNDWSNTRNNSFLNYIEILITNISTPYGVTHFVRGIHFVLPSFTAVRLLKAHLTHQG